MLTIMRKLLAYLLRIDNLDRIMVFVSIALFLVTPSYVLYWTTESNQVTDTVIRCITLIGVIAGSGVITLVRPIRTTPFYFLELLIVYSIQFSEFNPLGFYLNFVAIFWLEIIYCIIGFLVSLFSYKHYAKRKKKQTSAMNEDTNEDTVYDFLNASDANKHIEEDIVLAPCKNLFFCRFHHHAFSLFHLQFTERIFRRKGCLSSACLSFHDSDFIDFHRITSLPKRLQIPLFL